MEGLVVSWIIGRFDGLPQFPPFMSRVRRLFRPPGRCQRRDVVSLSVKLKIMATVTREHGPRELFAHVAQLIYSTSKVYVLRRDLSIPLIPRPEGKVPITLRQLKSSDLPQILAERPSGVLTGVLRSGLPQCYVALTEDQEICFLQWLITPENRERIRRLRFQQMPAFADDTVMLEF
jgi:hypothetical protein